MNRLDVRMFGLLLVPYAVVALTALDTASSPDAGPPQATAPMARQGPHDYPHCLAQHRLDNSEAVRLQRVGQARHDPLSRSQSPTWMQQARHDLESCLRAQSL